MKRISLIGRSRSNRLEIIRLCTKNDFIIGGDFRRLAFSR